MFAENADDVTVRDSGVARRSIRPPTIALSTSSTLPSIKLIFYSKPGCCLCDGLKEKLNSAFSLAASDSLSDVVLLVRDITSNPEWENAYQYEIPVLAKLLPGGSEFRLLKLRSEAYDRERVKYQHLMLYGEYGRRQVVRKS